MGYLIIKNKILLRIRIRKLKTVMDEDCVFWRRWERLFTVQIKNNIYTYYVIASNLNFDVICKKEI